ncbi:NAD(P)H-dependent glycerol-3-phosphate dehydrogenase [Paracoccus spongiarum]|uniref:Glycerol-3-phosphate dehydrogenase [NAD(P)+] n=1 Tax=Paracoccus spongiarum TaxID=3064387 RepID=A0ABT9JCG1_9RHOB|nr:NAD(P)H-dependent glycerol-3-phosphate dehydrogenase [Paracoccus sp. 2205BS29-5]MDP5307469.1 NAD(P)H-dependent glycerol-3-phosphate dehydrogenase [Paracoccus sp. 2205BS29-5]
MSVAILGAGAFGTALAVALSANGPVTLWGRDVGWGRINPRLPGVALPEAVRTGADLRAAAAAADTILLALPAQLLAGFLADHAALLDGKRLVSTAKGIDLTRLTGASALLGEACPSAAVAVLTGPSFAADIARGLPTALTLACARPDAGLALQHALSTPVLRLYRTTDVTGAELGGALKNVIAIAAGVVIGAGLGDSARAAIITRGFAEMTRLAVRLGARPETLAGLSGLGDLTLTCTSPQSRNFRFGRALGAAEDFDAATTVEGAATARAVAALSGRLGEDMPVAAMVARLADGGVSVEKAVEKLMSRPLKEE